MISEDQDPAIRPAAVILPASASLEEQEEEEAPSAESAWIFWRKILLVPIARAAAPLVKKREE